MNRKLKVLMLGRTGLFDALGGDRIQIENTALELQKLGVDVELKTGLDFNPVEYDIVHIFQLDWNPDAYFQAGKVSKFNKPIVLSPIHHSVKEVQRFDNEFIFDFRRPAKYLFKNQFHRDTFKDVYRAILRPKRIPVTVFEILKGLENMHKTVLNLSTIVLVQTKKEALDLRETFNIDFNWEKVVNGVASHFSSHQSFANPLPFDNYVISVGRIEPRKNQLTIIKAMKKFRTQTGLDTKLVLIGKAPGSHHFEYRYRFNKAVKENADWITHIDKVDYSQMPAYYSHAKVNVSASWFETTGLTSLEAVMCGANAVASGQRAEEYLGDLAFYCDPGEVDSITDAVVKAYNAPTKVVPENIRNTYTWEHAAKTTLEIYGKILEGGSDHKE